MRLIQTKNRTIITIIRLAVFFNFSLTICAMDQHSLASKHPIILPLPQNFPRSFGIKINTNNEKYQQSIHSMLADTLYEEWICPCTIHKTTIIQSLPPIFHIPTIIAHKIIDFDLHNNSDQLAKTITNYMPLFAPQTSSPKDDRKKHNAKESMINILYKHSFKKNISTQLILSNRLLDRCNISLEKQKNANKQIISCAFEYLTFLLTLHAKNIPIATSKELTNKLLKIRNQSSPSLQYILQVCRYLQAHTDDEKKRFFDLLETYNTEQTEQDIRELCLFLINYGDPTLLPNDVIKKFIHTIKNQDNPSQFLRRITQEPLTDVILHKLHSATLSNNEKELSNLYIIIAELYYYDKNFMKAHEFFSKNNVNTILDNTINQKIYKHAFNACVAHSESFTDKNIDYLFSLINKNYKSKNNPNSMYNFLLETKEKNKNLSYKMALLIHALNKKSYMKITTEQQLSLINSALNHLKYSGYEGNLSAKLNMACATIYKNNNDIYSSFEYIIRVMKHNALINKQNDVIINIIQNAQRCMPKFYITKNSLIFHIIQCINNLLTKNELINTFDLKILRKYALRHFFSLLLPYCEQAYKTNKNNKSETISYLLAFYYFKNEKYGIAHYFIDQLQSVPENMLLLKTKIYTAHNKALSPAELCILMEKMIVDKSLINNNTFMKHIKNTIAHAALLAKDFFIISPQHYEFARKLIIHYGELESVPTDIVLLTLFINDHLTANNNSYLDIWNKTLNESQFYNKLMDATYYNPSINYKIAQLLFAQKDIYHHYEKTISHFNAAINNPHLSPADKSNIEKCCSELYYNWALSKIDDENEHFRLLDIAITQYNNKFARNEKAKYIILCKRDITLLQEAQELLLKNIQEHGTITGDAAILMAHCHLHGALMEIPPQEGITEIFSFDIDKAIEYLIKSQEPMAQEILAIIYSGIAPGLSSSHKEKYINYEQTMHYTNILLNINYRLPEILMMRNYIYCKFNQPDHALNEINKYLLIENSPIDNDGINALLMNTFNFIFDFTFKDNDYHHAITCFEMRYKLYEKNNLHLRFNTIEKTQEHTAKILNDNITTDSAIKWCCLAAFDECFQHNNQNPTITYDKSLLLNYLYTAAKGENIDAQRALLPYLIKHSNSIITINTTLLYDALYYVHKELIHHNSIKKTKEIDILIQQLQTLIKAGYATACYIYLNYCKHDTKEFEDTLIMFSKVQIPIFYINDKYSLMQEITDSCNDIFNKYAQECIHSSIKLPLNIIATIIFASMLMCSENAEKLKLAIKYFESVLKALVNNLHLPYYKNIIQLLLSETYYKYERIEKSITHIRNIDLLKKSACLNHLSACYTLGDIYIRELLLFKEKPLTINKNDFLPFINKYIKTNKEPISGYSDLLLHFYEAIAIIEEYETILRHVINDAYTKKMIQTKYNQNNKTIAQRALESYELNKNQALNNLPKTIDSAKNPLLSIKLACIFLMGTSSYKQNYETSRNHLVNALNQGLVETKNNQQKKFHDGYFLNTLFIYMNRLIQNNHPEEITQTLLSAIKNAIHAAKINLDDFYTFFKKINKIDLSTHPLWKNSL